MLLPWCERLLSWSKESTMAKQAVSLKGLIPLGILHLHSDQGTYMGLYESSFDDFEK